MAKPSFSVAAKTSMDERWASSGEQLAPANLVIVYILTSFSMSTDPEARREYGPYLEGVGPVYKDKDGVEHIIRYNNTEDLEAALAVHGKNVAAFLVEPIQGEAG